MSASSAKSWRPHWKVTLLSIAVVAGTAVSLVRIRESPDARQTRRDITSKSSNPLPSATPAVEIGSQPNRVSHTNDISSPSHLQRDRHRSDTRGKLADLTERLRRAPKNVDARIYRGRLYYQLGALDKSQADLALAVETAPGRPDAWADYGYLQELRGRPDDALAAYDKAIDLGLKSAETFCNRAKLRRNKGKYGDAIADFTAAIGLLSNDASSEREQLLQYDLYLGRGYASCALGEWPQALADFRQLVQLRSDSPVPHSLIAGVHFSRKDYDQFTASVLEAIRLNTGDAGRDYTPTTNLVLSAEALQHGEEQVRGMLKDRPAMAEHISPGDELWTWAVRKFAGEDSEVLVDWDSSDPSPFEADTGASRNTGHAWIRVRPIPDDTPSERNHSFDSLWQSVVFELHNVAALHGFENIDSLAIDGQVTREEYVWATVRLEGLATQRTRAFYLKVYLPWARSRNLLKPQLPPWYCFAFYSSEDALRARWQSLPHWRYYSASFHLLRAEGEFVRGETTQMAEHLDIMEAHRDSLTSSQISSLNYWRRRLQEATPEKERARQQFETARRASLGRATDLHQAGSSDEAIHELTTLIENHRDWPDGFSSRGYVFYSQGEWQKALADFDAAIQLAPNQAELYLYRANVYCATRQFDKAWDDYSRYIELEPENSLGYYSRARLLLEWKPGPQSSARTAIQDARRSCEQTNWLLPERIELLAEAYAASGDVASARYFKELAAQPPGGDVAGNLKAEPANPAELPDTEPMGVPRFVPE